LSSASYVVGFTKLSSTSFVARFTKLSSTCGCAQWDSGTSVCSLSASFAKSSTSILPLTPKLLSRVSHASFVALASEMRGIVTFFVSSPPNLKRSQTSPIVALTFSDSWLLPFVVTQQINKLANIEASLLSASGSNNNGTAYGSQ